MATEKGIGQRMLEYRASHGLTQKELAKLLGISSYMVWYCERGDREPRAVNVVKLTKRLEEMEEIEHVKVL